MLKNNKMALLNILYNLDQKNMGVIESREVFWYTFFEKTKNYSSYFDLQIDESWHFVSTQLLVF